MNVRMKLTSVFLVLVMTLMMLPVQGCASQSDIAALVTVLGNAAAALAAMQGSNPALAVQIKADTAAATTAILAWKKGTNAQMAMQALSILETDLALIPYISPYAPMVDLAIATVDSLITIITHQSPVTFAQPPVTGRPHRHPVMLSAVPKDVKHFKLDWNRLTMADPKLAPLALK